MPLHHYSTRDDFFSGDLSLNSVRVFTNQGLLSLEGPLKFFGHKSCDLINDTHATLAILQGDGSTTSEYIIGSHSHLITAGIHDLSLDIRQIFNQEARQNPIISQNVQHFIRLGTIIAAKVSERLCAQAKPCPSALYVTV